MPHSSSSDPIKSNHVLPDPLHPEKLNQPQTTTSQPDSLSRTVDNGSTASLSQTFDTILPVAGPPPEHSPSQDSPFQSSSPETSKRRPLPTPPLMLQHSLSSSELHRISDPIPSSPPPPYSMFLPTEGPLSMTRDLSRVVTSASHTILAPEAPVIMPPIPNDQVPQNRAPYDTFLCHSPPANTWIAVETSQYEYVLQVRLPGFRRDGITIATKRRRILHVVADSWEPEGGHFERRVSFGYDAELAQVRAEFDGEMLRIIIPRHISAIAS